MTEWTKGSRSIDEPRMSLSEGYHTAVSFDARHLRVDLITGKGVPSTLALGLGEADSNWINTDGMNWFSLAPFFEGEADIAPQ